MNMSAIRNEDLWLHVADLKKNDLPLTLQHSRYRRRLWLTTPRESLVLVTEVAKLGHAFQSLFRQEICCAKDNDLSTGTAKTLH